MSALSEQEEFEFRLRAEREAKSPVGAGDTPQSWGDVAGKAATNFIPSMANMVKGIATAVTSPIETTKGVLDIAAGGLQNALPNGVVQYINNKFPSESAEEAQKKADLVGKFYVDRYGSMDGFKKALGQDPAGVMADAATVLSGGGAVASKLPMMANVGKALTKAGQAVDPILITGRAIGKVANPVGRIAADVIGGIGTHTGGESISQVFNAGMQGGNKAKEVADNLRGRSGIDEVLDNAKSALENIRSARSAEYKQAMQGVAKDKTVLDFQPVENATNAALSVSNFKGKSLNRSALDTQKKIIDLIDEWKNSDPVEFHTPEGFDALKKSIGDIRDSTQYGTPSRVVADRVYNSVKGQIAKQAPEYSKIMKDYSTATELVNEIQSSLLGKHNASADSAMRKLQSLITTSKRSSGNRGAMAKELEAAGAPNLMSNLSAQALQQWTPRGLAGTAALGLGGLGYVMGGAPLGIPLLAMQSPRLMGEAALKVGRAVGDGKKASNAFQGMMSNVTGGLPIDNYLYQLNLLNQQSEEQQ